MDIKKILKQYDKMYGERSLEEIYAFLENTLGEAYEDGDFSAAVTILNELIGFCRDTDRREQGLLYCDQVRWLMNEMGMTSDIGYATTLINIANAYRAFGFHENSKEYYEQAEKMCQSLLLENDFLMASLYNNWGLLEQEKGDFKRAVETFQKAEQIADLYPKHRIEAATTRTNMAIACLHMDPPNLALAKSSLQKAMQVFEADGGRDFHYSAALAAMGDLLYLEKDYIGSMNYYKQAMEALVANVGRTESYERIADNYRLAKEKAIESGIVLDDLEAAKCTESLNHRKDTDTAFFETAAEDISSSPSKLKLSAPQKLLERCKELFEMTWKSELTEHFGNLYPYMAIGLVGEGSECYGFDDKESTDHDYAPRLMIWLEDEVYESCHKELEEWYQQQVAALNPLEMGEMASMRGGIFKIGSFYEYLTGVRDLDQKVHLMKELSGRESFGMQGRESSNKTYTKISESVMSEALSEKGSFDELMAGFAAASNGEVFYDGPGIFSEVRDWIRNRMPESFRRRSIALKLHEFSQAGQYNYLRMMKREDYVSAMLCKARAINAALQLTALCNRCYAPYYKWIRKRVSQMKILPEISDICRAIADMEDERDAVLANGSNKIAMTFDIISALLLNELKEQGLIADYDKDNAFADLYWKEVLDMSDMEKAKQEPMSRDEMIETIVKIEWEMFDEVINEGGRADCQDNWGTFSIMRKSQYMTWPDELLSSYLYDLTDGLKEGRNLITEKYGRMMEFTAPEKYEKIKDHFPVRNEDRIKIQEMIIGIQVSWMETFSKEYPNLAQNARSVHTDDDSDYNTSYETYLRGELGTYSDDTLMLYGRYIAKLANDGENLAYMTMNNTAVLYGYKNADDAEEHLKM